MVLLKINKVVIGGAACLGYFRADMFVGPLGWVHIKKGPHVRRLTRIDIVRACLLILGLIGTLDIKKRKYWFEGM